MVLLRGAATGLNSLREGHLEASTDVKVGRRWFEKLRTIILFGWDILLGPIFHVSVFGLLLCLSLLSEVLIGNQDSSPLLLDPFLYPGFELGKLDNLGDLQRGACEWVMLVVKQVMLDVFEVTNGSRVRELDRLPHQVVEKATQEFLRGIIS
jgi:hypothetical protein